MAKMKTRRAAAKRFTLTGGGKLKRRKAFKNHILTKKTAKRKMGLRQADLASAADVKRMKKALGI
jgi:large subunit ribosomal protein L35